MVKQKRRSVKTLGYVMMNLNIRIMKNMMNFSGKKNYYVTLLFLRIHYNYSHIFLSLISAVLLNTVKLGDLLTALIKGLLYTYLLEPKGDI